MVGAKRKEKGVLSGHEALGDATHTSSVNSIPDFKEGFTFDASSVAPIDPTQRPVTFLNRSFGFGGLVGYHQLAGGAVTASKSEIVRTVS